MGMVAGPSMIVAMKEIYGWLLIVSIASFLIILVSFTPLRPHVIFPKWRTIRKIIRKSIAMNNRKQQNLEEIPEKKYFG